MEQALQRTSDCCNHTRHRIDTSDDPRHPQRRAGADLAAAAASRTGNEDHQNGDDTDDGGLASSQVLGATGWTLDTTTVDWNDVRQLIGLPGVSQDWSVNFWPIGVGLALFAVSAVFRHGQKLHKDTQGLI